MQLPVDVVNRALYAIGAQIIGSFEDGTTTSEAARAIYGITLRDVLGCSHWSFARKHAPLQLLADKTGQTLDPGTNQPISQAVETPWTYAYAWPSDGVRARWLAYNFQQPTSPPSPPPPPMVGGLTIVNPGAFIGERPAPFLLAISNDFPAAVGQVDWDNMPETGERQGLIGRQIILTNVKQAKFVYTSLVLEPDLWDGLFGTAMDAVLGARLALPALVNTDTPFPEQAKYRQYAIQVRNAQIAIAKDAITQARVASANEAGFPQSTDIIPDWIRARRFGGSGFAGGWDAGYGGGYNGPGYLWCGWGGISFGDGGGVF